MCKSCSGAYGDCDCWVSAAGAYFEPLCVYDGTPSIVGGRNQAIPGRLCRSEVCNRYGESLFGGLKYKHAELHDAPSNATGFEEDSCTIVECSRIWKMYSSCTITRYDI